MSIVLILPSAIAYGPTVKYASHIYPYQGSYTSTDVNKIKSVGGGDILFTGYDPILVWMGLHFEWFSRFVFSISFQLASGSYSYIAVDIRFNYYGLNPMQMHVFYQGSGAKNFYIESTGGYVRMQYVVDANRIVTGISFTGLSNKIYWPPWNPPPKPYLYLDYIVILYEA